MRDLAMTITTMAVLLAAGFVAGWHWRGHAVEMAVSQAVAAAKIRHEAERRDLEARVATARAEAAEAARVAERAEQDLLLEIESISGSAGSELDIINRQIREVFR